MTSQILSDFSSAMEIWRPFTQMQRALPPLKVKRTAGSLMELENGKTLIDAISSWWVITHGHCQPEIVESIRVESQKRDQVLFANFTHPKALELISLLQDFLPPSLSKAFFSDNGSTSVEVALKLAIHYWQHRGENQRVKFLSFEHAYHGDTAGAMSVSGKGLFTRPYKNLLFPVLHLRQGRYSEDSASSFTEHLEEVLSLEHEKIAGLILEPLIQGAGGMIIWPKKAVQNVLDLCHQKKILVIFDEVMTGFGRTGSLFTFEHFTSPPDLLCLSKGLTGGLLPLGLTLISPQIYEAFLSEEKSKMFFHGHSFTGNALSSAAAVANLRLLKMGNQSSQWEKIAVIHKERMETFQYKHLLRDMRSKGLIAALELGGEEEGYASSFAETFTAWALERGVFLRPLGKIVYILPPYSITEDQLNYVWDIIEEGVHLFHKKT